MENLENTDEIAASSTPPQRLRPLRAWPLLIGLPVMLVLRYLPQIVSDGPSMLWASAAFGPALCSIVLLLWWCFASRASWQEKVGGLLAIIAGVVLTAVLMDPTMRGIGIIVMALPLGVAAFAITLGIVRNWLDRKRTLVAVIAGLLALLSTTLLKSDGVWGNFAMGLQWRWSPSAEQRAIDFAESRQSDGVDVSPDRQRMEDALASAEWPSFRGARRDGVQRGTAIDRDWNANPPQEVWRIPIGPAWSSFVVAGDLLITQEQRGDDEMVVCYLTIDGSEVWTHRLSSRFFEPLGGLGPRATPTLSGETVFAMGAEGFLVAVNALDGTLKWKVDVRELANRGIPMWGFSSSPVVSGDNVVIYAGGKDDLGVLALDANTGEVRWTAPCGPDSYASVQEIVIGDRPWLSILSNKGMHVYDPADGRETLMYPWNHDGYRALQPQVIAENQVLVPTGMGTGTRLIEIFDKDNELTTNEIWTSRRLKPDFNDCVIHEGYIYGFDDSIFTCIDLSDGEAMWKRGRYGKGQVLLLADSNALIVQCETGEVVLLDADAKQHHELGRIDGVAGKSWNHPVVVGDRLYVRSSEEAACYKLKTIPNDDLAWQP
ncbi:outer membrane protein assembly factor BamB family protein [Rubripirellula reticaptiva]|uniref:Outer membrane biogenesis protein BamB n=1 Tax=Rubripirellula reticaptiva TaxID=2528013 RepID=A0A5C6ENW7_9BACT|nr:PQQ-binding-like beta-propeller repeat protein [Rubripirellula reticaptiva]TWU49059.1 outer membrane biogenesis protein BamB [Rubripirellula reticaptiva]